MFESFDDLFNEFFNKKKKTNPLQDEIKKLIESIAQFKNIKNEAMLEKEIDKELGKPSIIEERIENGLRFKKITWHTPTGSFVKIIVTDVNDTSETEPTTASLEEQLKEAVESENYELAIQLRDQIKKTKAPKKERKPRTKK